MFTSSNVETAAATYHNTDEQHSNYVIELPTGQLRVSVANSDYPLDYLCGFAARRNPKRGFLFVSRVLGKHIPVRPSAMRDIHTRLARKISANLPGPVAFVGMAETAIGLGHGVYDEYVRLTGRTDAVFIHSTRYRLRRRAAMEFREEHSHATDHIIYQPEDRSVAHDFANARSVVLVDDEASTGTTFINLAREFKANFPKVERMTTVVITDWRGPKRTQECHAAMSVPTDSVAILEGTYSFQAAPHLVAIEMPKVTGNNQYKDRIVKSEYGRLGLRGYETVPHAVAPLADGFRAAPGARCLILGTGEFAYPPFVLAEQLERRGLDVLYQSTTRSPIMEGGAIGCSLTFADNYRDGIANFIYNARRDAYDRIVVCHETPVATVDPVLLNALGATELEL